MFSYSPFNAPRTDIRLCALKDRSHNWPPYFCKCSYYQIQLFTDIIRIECLPTTLECGGTPQSLDWGEGGVLEVIQVASKIYWELFLDQKLEEDFKTHVLHPNNANVSASSAACTVWLRPLTVYENWREGPLPPKKKQKKQTN